LDRRVNTSVLNTPFWLPAGRPPSEIKTCFSELRTMPAPFARLLPRREERDVFTNILALLALPLLAGLIFALVEARTYYLELSVLAKRPAMLSVEVDLGDASRQQGLMAVPLQASPQPQTVRFQFPPCRLQQLLLHASAGAAVNIGQGEFRCAADEFFGLDKVYATFAPAGLQYPPADSSPPPVIDGYRAMFTIPGLEEAAVAVPLSKPLLLGFDWSGFALAVLIAFAEYALAAIGTLLAWRRLRDRKPARRRVESATATAERFWRIVVAAARAHPSATIWAVAVCGVVLSCYPVIFFGKSFVSPNIGTPLLYDGFPTLPGSTDASTGDAQGSDVLAAMSSFVPYAMVQRHSLLVDHEFPFLDRYNQCGLPFLAQGQTMIGDPLHLLMLLAGANAWAWDVRFLLSRLLFAAAIGLIVRFTTRQTAVALLLTFSCCFLGFFHYRLSHPTYFCLCYAPWILLPWLRLPGAGTLRQAGPWIGLLLLADWMEINAGPIKDAYLLTISLNLCGVLILLLSAAQRWSRRWPVLALTLWCEAALILLSNPFWVTPLDMIVHSWNIYLTPRLWQIQPSLLIGFFDDIFYRQYEFGERLFSPGTNFLIFLGIAFAASYFKILLRNRVFLAVGLCSLAALAVLFGIIPPAMIENIPFLANVLHIDDVFSTILIVPAIVLAGFGLAECRRRLRGSQWSVDYIAALGVLGFLTALFLGQTQAQQRSAIHDLGFNEEVAKSFFFWCDAVALALAFAALPLLLRHINRARWGLAPWIAVCLATMLWRHGQQLHFVPGLDRYVSRPQVRVDFYRPSAAVNYIHQHMPEPGRVLGLRNNLFPGTSGMFGLEGITGSDALIIPAYHTLLAAQAPLEWDWRPVIDIGTVRRFKAFYDLLNARFYLGPPGGLPFQVPGVNRVAKLDLDVFESKDVWPRAFYTDVLSTFPDPQGFLSAVARNDGHPFAAREAAAPISSFPAGVSGLPTDEAARVIVPATNYHLTDNTTTFEIHAPAPGVVVLTEVYNGENKQVAVNGRPAPHFPVNVAFEGVYLDHAGDFTVSFRSWPRYFTAGLYVSALGFLLLVGTAAILYLPRPIRRPRTVRLPAPEFATQL
jgi:hypothetical protein